MGILLGRAVAVVVSRIEGVLASCGGCGGKITSSPCSGGTSAKRQQTEAANSTTAAPLDKMSSSTDGNCGLQQKVIIIPDIHIQHASSLSCVNSISSRSCEGEDQATVCNRDDTTTSSCEQLTTTAATAATATTCSAVRLRQTTRSMLRSNNSVDINNIITDNGIELPERFRKSLGDKNSAGSNTNCLQAGVDVVDGSEKQAACTWQDISRAISWIQQELENMREQDKVLLRQFLDLRAAIRGLRAEGGRLRTMSYGGREDKTETQRQQSGGSEVNDDVIADDDDDVFTSTSEETPSFLSSSLLHGQCRIEFRGRTVSCVSPGVKYNVADHRHLTES